MSAEPQTAYLPLLAVPAPKPTALTAPSSLPGRSTRLLFQDASGALLHASPATGWEVSRVGLPAAGRVLAAAAGRDHVVALLEGEDGAPTLAFTPLAEAAWAAWRLPFACKPFASLTPAGDVVVTDDAGAVVLLHLEARSVTTLGPAGFARQVHAGSDGSLWAVRDQDGFGGYAVAVRRSGADDWFTLPDPASAVKVIGLRDGTAYGMNPLGEVWRFHPQGVGSFAECSEDAGCRNCLFSERRAGSLDLALGPDDVVWTVSAAGRASVLDSGRRVSFEAPIAGVRAIFGSYAG